MTAISEESWERAFTAVKEQFEIANLLPEQDNSLREFLFADWLWQIFNILNVFQLRRTLFSKGLVVPVSL